jgi:hypothetical protein
MAAIAALSCSATSSPASGRQEAADHHLVAARGHDQPLRPGVPVDAQPAGIEPDLLALAVRRHPLDNRVAVGQDQGPPAPGIEAAALEAQPQQQDVEADEFQHRPGAEHQHGQPDRQFRHSW